MVRNWHDVCYTRRPCSDLIRPLVYMRACFQIGDRIIEVDGVDLRHSTHERAVEVIQAAGNPVCLLVQSLVHLVRFRLRPREYRCFRFSVSLWAWIFIGWLITLTKVSPKRLSFYLLSNFSSSARCFPLTFPHFETTILFKIRRNESVS